MKSHTLILTTTKTAIPADLNKVFVTSLINRGLALTEYFGEEIDNQHDFIDEDMDKLSAEITFIEIFFDTEAPIEYDLLTETDIDTLILDLFDKSPRQDFHTDGKDVTVHLHH